jgi:hypothetical protein
MKTPFGFQSMAALVLLVATLAFPHNVPTAAAASTGLDDEQKKADQMVNAAKQIADKYVPKELGFSESVGALAPIALSPFFALTCLSGASILAEHHVLPDAVSKNAFLTGNGVLNNPFVFFGLLALTVITAAPKLTKVTKPLAQAIDQIEAHSGIIAVAAVQLLSSFHVQHAQPQTAEMAVFYQAGLLDVPWGVLMAAFSVVNIFVVNTVKFFFEVLVFLSPFPAVDAALEAANKTVTGALIALYIWSPAVATVLNLIIFFVCLVIFAWAYRRVVYMRSILGDPVLGWMAERIFRRPHVTPTSTRLSPSLARAVPDAKLVLKAFSGKHALGLKRKTRGFLVLSGDRLQFVRRRFLRSPHVVALPSAGHTVKLDRGLLSNAVVIENDAGDVAMSVLFTRRYNPVLDSIRTLVGAAAPVASPANTGLETMMGASRSSGAAVKQGQRESLRAEMA